MDYKDKMDQIDQENRHRQEEAECIHQLNNELEDENARLERAIQSMSMAKQPAPVIIREDPVVIREDPIIIRKDPIVINEVMPTHVNRISVTGNSPTKIYHNNQHPETNFVRTSNYAHQENVTS